jgi:hypothetical protein
MLAAFFGSAITQSKMESPMPVNPASLDQLNLEANAQNHVVIHVPHDIAFNLKKVNEITAKVLGKLGCDGCHSGRILEYRVIREFAVNPKNLEIQDVIRGL